MLMYGLDTHEGNVIDGMVGGVKVVNDLKLDVRFSGSEEQRRSRTECFVTLIKKKKKKKKDPTQLFNFLDIFISDQVPHFIQ